MKIAVCQGEAVGGSPSRDMLIQYWDKELKKIPDVEQIDYYEVFNENMIGDHDAVVGAWIRDGFFNKEFFEKYPKLKYIATLGHGFGKVDVEAAKENHVTITNTIYGDVTIAQYAFALLMNICHHVDREDLYYKDKLKDGNGFQPGHKKVCTRQIELFEKTIGIVGLGNIGLWMAKMAQGFGMKVISYSRHKKQGDEYSFIEQVSLEELLKRSDVISIHCPLTDETRGMIDRAAIESMKDGVIIINTARGAIIDEEAMVEALHSGKIYAAGLDVVDGEPVRAWKPIFGCENASVTAHIAWAPEEARYRTVRLAAQNLKNWMEGHPTSMIY